MRALALVSLAAAVLCACATASPVASHTGGPSPVSPTPSSSSPAQPSPSESPSAAPTPTSVPSPPAPKVSCVPALIPGTEALVGGNNGWFLYGVDDPARPRTVCRMQNTYIHILTGTAFEYLVPKADGTTDVVLHALGSNNESVAATLKADLTLGTKNWVGPIAWTPDLHALAYVADGGTDAAGFSVSDVWIATASARTRVFSFSVPGKDSFGRPGFAPVTLGFSGDGAYLVAGWTVSLSPIHVFRVSDGADVSPALPADLRYAFWSKTGATLYFVGTSGVAEWTPGSAVRQLSGLAWTLDPSFSPDGQKVAFTVVTSTHEVRTYVFDLAAKTNRLLVALPRSSAQFVKSGWLWQMEEKPCVQVTGQPCFDPTGPDGNILAYDLATGHEQRVVFQAGDTPTNYGLTAGDLWPSA